MLPLQVPAADAATREFCLDGKFDLGARYQGMHPAPGEFTPTRWCVITEDDSSRVRFHGAGKSNPDMQGEFTVSYLPPDTVRIVNRESPPDVEFHPADIAHEARRNRRIDPRRLVEELEAHAERIAAEATDGGITVDYPGETRSVRVHLAHGRLERLETSAELPLRGTVPVVWRWEWPAADTPRLTLAIDGVVLFRARGTWRELDAAEAAAAWSTSGGEPPHAVPGDAWPARTGMRLETLADGVYLARGVRTGFHHLIVDTDEGLVVGDAPAGWLEVQQIPPADLVPGLGISGLSERFVDALREELPHRPLRAVVLTHAHDDHAGGARAFAAAGAEIYGPAPASAFLTAALNDDTMPSDRLEATDRALRVIPVEDRVSIGSGENRVELVALGKGPHVSASIGMLAAERGYFFQSDLHLPISDAPRPRSDRLATECWFAAWATANLDPDTVVVGSHGNVRTPVARLTAYLSNDGCDSPHGRDAAVR